jgi:hypothetical protein
MQLLQIDVSGCRLVGATTPLLGMDGPKHHALVLGKGAVDGEIYIAELMAYGYQIATYKDFYRRYAANGQIHLFRNPGPDSDAQVVQRAIDELRQGGMAYDLIINNCESFVNRVTHGDSSSSQVVNTVLGMVALAGMYYVIKNSK